MANPTKEFSIDEKKAELSLDIPLSAGANRITAIAYDEKGFSSNPKYVDVICKDSNTVIPNLYVIAVGISEYPNLSLKLQLEYAHTDARAIANVFQSQTGKMFGEVRPKILINENATIGNITEALETLNTISEDDIVIIFMAGHGAIDINGTFYFLTSNGSFKEPQHGGINWSLIANYLSNIKGRVILLLDACHSGGIVTETVVPNDELAQQFFSGRRGGAMVFSASKGRQFSYESPDIGKGAGIFTYAISEGIGSKSKLSDINGNGYVEFSELVQYVINFVDQETNGDQTPWLSRKELFGDLPLAAVSIN